MSSNETPAESWRSLLEVEDRGIEPIPESEQTSGPAELFWIWFAGNISILGLPLGIWVVAGELNFWQALIAGLVGAVGSFAIVGVVSIAGQRGGAPTLTLSRATFGVRGNYLPTFVAIVSRWGWETVNTVTAAFAAVSIGTVIAGHELTQRSHPWIAVIAVLIFLALTLAVSGVGHQMLAAFQKWATYIFGALTLVVIGFIVLNTDWNAVLNTEAGSWGTVLAGIGIVASGTGIAWANSGADIGRYQSKKVSPTSLIMTCAAGAGIPLVIMIGAGSLTGITNPEFDTGNPLASIPALLPAWMSIPFLVSAFAGLLLSNNISVYSSGLTLLTIGLKVRRIVAVAADLLVSLVGAMVFLFLFESFYDAFIGFITLLAIPLAAWLAIFVVDMIKRTSYSAKDLLDLSPTSSYWYTNGFEIRGLVSWLIAFAVGFVFKFGIPDSFIAQQGLEWLAALLTGGVLYLIMGGARVRSAQS